MITLRPSAARAVSSGRILSARGRISPNAPRTSQTPMKRIKLAGKGDMAASTSGGVTSLLPPANRNSAAKSP
jgi:hypothetical protein